MTVFKGLDGFMQKGINAESEYLDDRRGIANVLVDKMLPPSNNLSMEKGIKYLLYYSGIRHPSKKIIDIITNKKQINSKQEFDILFKLFSYGKSRIFISKKKKDLSINEIKNLQQVVENIKEILENYLKEKNSGDMKLGKLVVRLHNHSVLEQNRVRKRFKTEFNFFFTDGKIITRKIKKLECVNRKR
ncbi:hypothetical protein J7J26_01075 [Candidatus Micrarchaeota archaeon]|nr:hypothetical protein [Candidatus Micrarchaeota archaeon]